ncbi:hypothetical protein HAX54_018328 [Datura stramonium]|uniref:Uncharacterized protein n=1 Tax=Datura stramonium TaxID=4076 RepID=A0ABS8UMC0_DATST|nr:hypothetical protein [Datura stramonium]
MADAKQSTICSGDPRQPSRLQRRAPAWIQINRSTDWNVAIPLLSPLISSTESSNLTATINSISGNKEEVKKEKSPAVLVFKKWQHPATPFCYEQPSRLQRRAPASIQINRSTDWDVDIPLLSLLISSPESSNLTAAINLIFRSKEEVKKEKSPAVLVFKKWQHPATPFSY